MTVFVLKYWPDLYSRSWILGIYSTKHLAEAARDSHSEKMREKDYDSWNYEMSWAIQDVELDKRDWI